MNRNFVDDEIFREIKRKSEKLEEHRKNLFKLGNRGVFDFIISKHIAKVIEKDATMHSYKIEYPGQTDTSFYNAHPSRRSVRKSVEGLFESFNWGKQNFDPQNINEDYIRNLAGRIDVVFHGSDTAKYRDIGVRVTGATWMPPYPEKIPREMERFIQYLKYLLTENDLRSNLEAAIFTHLHLVRIHPFADTNGRTARTLQNVILNNSGLPLPIVYAGERHDYYEHLNRAIEGWRYRTSSDREESIDNPNENSFYNYTAGKVSASLDRILQRR
mgnify:CR=1 FL=1